MTFHDISNKTLSPQGEKRIAWAEANMPVLRGIREEWKKKKPLRGLRVAACLHVTTETANLMRTLKAGGASVALAASNPLSTQDDVAAALVRGGIAVHARHGESRAVYYKHLDSLLATHPHILMDDGADLMSVYHKKHAKKKTKHVVIGGTEETTTGVIRLRSLAASGKLLFSVIAVNDAKTKHLFDNRYGTGQSVIDGILRATNVLLAGKHVVVCGYGWCGRGVALRARGMGAHVTVTETDATKALEAVMDGFPVMPMTQAAAWGEIFVTVTGNAGVVRFEHMRRMRDGAILANAGHFDVEIDVATLQRRAKKARELRSGVHAYALKKNQHIILLEAGRLINLAAAEGHPAAVMDMSFANQALSVFHLHKHHARLLREVYAVPEALDRMVAERKLKALGVSIDRVTKEQKKYLSSWEGGT